MRPKQELSQRDEAIRELEDQASEQDLRILQKDAVIQQLEERLLSQQRSLDDAIQEVVRAKAKQRSLGSRAEAASEMAEAEIALKTFRAEAAGTDSRELAQAKQLLQLAAGEFEKQNFGGALYLTNRAKGQIRLGTLVLDDQQKVGRLVGETPFAVPISLTLRATSNLRNGPGLEFEILGVLQKGTLVNGYSFKGAWLRVDQGDGTSGWIHQSLVSAG
jgi:paraquat-inducible protein B